MSTLKISTKKLKAIVFTDIVGFTKLSAEDEHYALELINKQRDVLKPIVGKHNGECHLAIHPPVTPWVICVMNM